MKQFKIKLSTIKDVQDFVRDLTIYSGDADLESGRYVVDAKSIMGIFSLDLQSPITLTLREEGAEGEAELLQKIAHLISE
ncbi:MAG: HPr family phosphocarrier protein [Clostridia bacterium]|nr:HPr family phosphocarrier protein [Clostridia bacterium]